MFYTVYKIVNLINEKYYIGVHKTKEPMDEYMGSGVGIKRAIKKYGKENFKKEILFTFDNEKEMLQKEKELVTETVMKDPLSYNATLGGIGSFAHIDSSCEKNPNYGKALWKKGKTEDEIKEINLKRSSPGILNGMYGKTHTEEAKEKIRKANKDWLQTDEGKASKKKQAEELSKRMKGKPKTEEQKRKMSDAAKNRWANKVK